VHQPEFTRHDVLAATNPETLAKGQELAEHVTDLDWDEYSLWGTLPAENITTGELMIHYNDRPLVGECACPDGKAAGLCAHMVALATTYLGDDTEFAKQVAALSHDQLVALVIELGDRSTTTRNTIRTHLTT
jgi:hypothetical protein